MPLLKFGVALMFSSLMGTLQHSPDHEMALQRAVEAAKDHRLVALGEATHGDGSTFLFKAELIRRLHRDHGFDVLAIESGIYSVADAEAAIAAGTPPSKAISDAIFPVWAKADQLQPLLELIDQAAEEDRPFSLIGFDFQLTGKNKEPLVEHLESIASRLGPNGAAVQALSQTLRQFLDAKEEALLALDLKELDDTRLRALESLYSEGGETQIYDMRTIDSLSRFLRFAALMSREGPQSMPPGELNIRDAVMAQNMTAQALAMYPDRKIILWGATSHFLKDRTAIDVQGAPGMIPMGAYIARGPLAKDFYVMGFSAFKGSSGSIVRGPYDLPPAEEDTIEASVMNAHPNVNVAFEPMPPCGSRKIKTRALGHAQWSGDWGCAIDGLIIFREMEPTSYSAE